MGQEAFIPYQLSQDHLPNSMRYYDPIIAIVEKEISHDKKEFFYAKNKINFENYKKYSLKLKVEDKIIGADKKLSFKHSIVN